VSWDTAVGQSAASLGATATVTATEADDEENPAYSIPWSETFDDRTLAGIDGQNGWTGGGTVQTGAVHSGTKARTLTNGTAAHVFSGNPSNIWITLWAQPVPSDAPATISSNASAVFYVSTNDLLVAYSNQTPLEIEGATILSNDWNKIELSCDYSSKVVESSYKCTTLGRHHFLRRLKSQGLSWPAVKQGHSPSQLRRADRRKIGSFREKLAK